MKQLKMIGWAASIGTRVAGNFSVRRPRTPTILQMEITDCGAASLAMILAYHGRWVSLEELRKVCGVSRDGVSANSIISVGQNYQLDVNAFGVETEQLSQVKMPSIIFWKFRHFLVLEGISNRYAWLNDPANGRKRISIEEFNDNFTGLVLEMNPGEGFKREGKPPDFFGFMVGQLQNSKKAIGILLIAGLALIVPGILIPAFSRIFVDEILLAGKESWLQPLLIGIFLTATLRLVVMGFQQGVLLRLQRKLAILLMGRTISHVLKLPMLFFAQREPGDLVSRISAGNRISELLANGLALNALGLIEILFFGVVMVFYAPNLAMVCFGLSGLNLLALSILKKRNEDANRLLAQESGKLSSITTRQTLGLEALQASGSEDHSFAASTGQQARYIKVRQKAGLIGMVQGSVPTFIMALSNVVILGLGALKIISGDLTIGTLVAFQSLFVSFSSPINNLMQLATNIQAIKGDVARLMDITNYAKKPTKELSDEISNKLKETRPSKLSGKIEVTDLSFGYASLAPPLIEGLSLKVEPGMRIAFVGPSGSGKSTIAKLLCGLYSPWKGTIKFNGFSRDTIPDEVFSASVAFVDQEFTLFEGTLRENLTLWDSEITDEALWKALEDAAISRLIKTRVGQLECHVEEAGLNFSGGERIRIEIARSLLREPSILVLDEATSALDTITEKAIDDALRRRGCSCIILAHRLSTIRESDEIVVLDQGQVVERGGHLELMAKKGVYHALISRE